MMVLSVMSSIYDELMMLWKYVTKVSAHSTPTPPE